MSSKIEQFLLHILSVLKTDISDYCDLETVDSSCSGLVAQDGSIGSIIRFHGMKNLVGRDDFMDMTYHLTNAITPFFKERGHAIQVLFHKGLDATEKLEEIAAQQRATADRIGLSAHSLINESVETYARFLYDEECFFVLWSRPSLLEPIEQKMALESNKKFRKKTNWPALSGSQNLLLPISYLKDRHTSFVNVVLDELNSTNMGCSAELLDVGQALREVRASIYPEFTPKNWRASIPGEKIPFRWKENSVEYDASELFYPKLSSQIMVAQAHSGHKKDALLPDPTTVKIGSLVYAPLIVTIPPREPQYFNRLFNALNRAETEENGQKKALPYVISFFLESDGLSGIHTLIQSVFGNILAFTSEQNRDINLSLKALREQKRDGACITKLRIAAMTWAKHSDKGLSELYLRKAKLLSVLSGWGQLEATERTGNPMDAVQSCSLGLSPTHIGEPCPAPLDDVIPMLPLTRPTSCFTRGSAVHRSLDGKILLEEHFSDELSTWLKLISGKPGSGKSVLLNNCLYESCLLPGASTLPYIGIIDIGISSAGFVEAIRDGLSPEQQYLALYKRIQNSTKDAMNMMDTPLCQRKPLPRSREFIRNFITMLVTPAERKGLPYTGMSSFVGRIIDLAYESLSDKVERASPKTYKIGLSAVTDNAIRKIGFTPLPATTYWEIADELFKAGMYYEAEIAQRYAVPILNDLMAIASSQDIQNEYGKQTTDSGNSLLSSFIIGIREAVADFPIFSSETQFDIGSARISALDLQDVTHKGSAAAEKQTALMFMAAREIFMKKLAFSAEDLEFFSPIAKPYYTELIADLVAQKKIMAIDEYHRAKNQLVLREQITQDSREARKWYMEIILASHFPEDFDSLIDLATSIFLLDSGTAGTRNWLRENIGLSDVEEAALVEFVHGPNRNGTTYLARFLTKKRQYSQLFTLNIGPQRLWRLSTTAEDRQLRDLLYKAMPHEHALILLAQRFPNGSCKGTVDALKMEASPHKDAEFVDDEVINEIVKQIAAEMIAKQRSWEPRLELNSEISI